MGLGVKKNLDRDMKIHFLVHIVVPPIGLQTPLSSLGTFSSSFIRGPVFHPIVDCEHPLLYLPGTGITSQEIAISGSCQQNLAGICNSVWVWWLYMGWIPMWGSLWMVLSPDKWILAQKLRLPKIQFAKHMKLKKKEDLLLFVPP
jgi:hypothetical protein